MVKHLRRSPNVEPIVLAGCLSSFVYKELPPNRPLGQASILPTFNNPSLFSKSERIHRKQQFSFGSDVIGL
jgi:hypothetical protein